MGDRGSRESHVMDLPVCAAAPWEGGRCGPWEESTHRYCDAELTALD